MLQPGTGHGVGVCLRTLRAVWNKRAIDTSSAEIRTATSCMELTVLRALLQRREGCGAGTVVLANLWG